MINYGLVADYRTQVWDTPVPEVGGTGSLRSRVVRRGAKIYQPDAFLSLKRKKWRLDAEIAFTLGSVGTHQQAPEVDIATGAVPQDVADFLRKGVNFFQVGGALQTDVALLSADALLFGVEFGAASGDKGAYGFGARPWRNGSGAVQPVAPGQQPTRAAGPGARHRRKPSRLLHAERSHADQQLPLQPLVQRGHDPLPQPDHLGDRGLVPEAVAPLPPHRPEDRRRRRHRVRDPGRGDLLAGLVSRDTPGLSRPLGLEFNAGITYDTSDRFHAGLAYGLLVPFDGLRNTSPEQSASIAHAVRMLLAIPF